MLCNVDLKLSVITCNYQQGWILTKTQCLLGVTAQYWSFCHHTCTLLQKYMYLWYVRGTVENSYLSVTGIADHSSKSYVESAAETIHLTNVVVIKTNTVWNTIIVQLYTISYIYSVKAVVVTVLLLARIWFIGARLKRPSVILHWVGACVYLWKRRRLISQVMKFLLKAPFMCERTTVF